MISTRLRNRGLSILAVLAAWWFITDGLSVFTPMILPSPLDVVRSAASLVNDGDLFSGGLYEANLFGHVLISVRRVCLAWSIAVSVALPLGLLIGAVPIFERYVGLSVQILSQIPPIAYVPLAIVWFGLGETPILFIIFIGALWTMLINVVSGVHKVPQVLLRAARSQGATDFQVFCRVLLPAAVPDIAVGLRLSFGIAWVAIVAAELVASSSGLGYLIMHARRILASGDIIVGCIGVLGILFDIFFRTLEHRMCPWK
jgi:NitT/TauT family transport system permease protein